MSASQKSSLAVVLGVNGQDGGYLAEALMDRGRPVSGVGRQSGPASGLVGLHEYRRLDLTRPKEVERTLLETEPATIFHFAAIHKSGGAALDDVASDAFQVNVASVQTSLDYARRRIVAGAPSPRIIYASSSRVFGAPLAGAITEAHPLRPNDYYGVTKKLACELIDFYRSAHGVDAAAIHFFNHESARRPEDYFIPTLTSSVISALAGAPRSEIPQVRSLDFHCDWGDAAEYMDLVARFAEAPSIQDCLLATGSTWRAQDLAEALFAAFGLDWRDWLDAEPTAPAPAPFEADPSRFARIAGARPTRTILELCVDLVRAAGADAQRGAALAP
ncbi:MAG: GDP-mannose 4,6-dehydratase [Pseudomonadota bacterium]